MIEQTALARLGRGDRSASRSASAVLVAVLTHGLLAVLAFEQEPARPPLVAVTEVELLPPPPAPEPPPEPPPAAHAHAPRLSPARAPRPAPAPARAAALRTIDDAVRTAEQPVRFVTDPNGTAFGYGVVARGGTAESAPAGAALPISSAGEGAAGGPSLSRPPRLAESEPCRGFFPARARVDRGEVGLRVRVERDGTVRAVAVARETPLGQGFGFAARDCLLSKRFTPALDQSGREVAVVSPVTVRFSR